MTTRDALRRELFEAFGETTLPDPVPLNLEILWKRTFLDYEEWKIEYDVESPETMPLEVGQRVPAYLLVPRHQPKPMPAMIAFHQCAGDCTNAKEAVVGKAPWVPIDRQTSYFETDGRVHIDRTDQAYGYELVHEGFVVLAPDSINCGERNIEAIRKPGEVRLCHSIIYPHLGKASEFKRVIDGVRAVDLLQSLDFVDSDRIAAIGHSMGAGGVYWVMAFDERVKAGIMGSRHWRSPFYPLIAPRPLMILWGAFDGKACEQEDLQKVRNSVYECYRESGASDSILIRKLATGHKFIDEFKWEAYARLKEHFGMVPDPEPLSLKELVIEARKATEVSWDDLDATFNEIEGPDVPITTLREQALSAIGGLFMFMADRSLSGSIGARVGLEGEQPFVSCTHTANEDLSPTPTPSDYSSMRGVRKILVELGATLQYEHSGKRITYRILLPAAK